jgi:hypothetical protein
MTAHNSQLTNCLSTDSTENSHFKSHDQIFSNYEPPAAVSHQELSHNWLQSPTENSLKTNFSLPNKPLIKHTEDQCFYCCVIVEMHDVTADAEVAWSLLTVA